MGSEPGVRLCSRDRATPHRAPCGASPPPAPAPGGGRGRAHVGRAPAARHAAGARPRLRDDPRLTAFVSWRRRRLTAPTLWTRASGRTRRHGLRQPRRPRARARAGLRPSGGDARRPRRPPARGHLRRPHGDRYDDHGALPAATRAGSGGAALPAAAVHGDVGALELEARAGRLVARPGGDVAGGRPRDGAAPGARQLVVMAAPAEAVDDLAAGAGDRRGRARSDREGGGALPEPLALGRAAQAPRPRPAPHALAHRMLHLLA